LNSVNLLDNLLFFQKSNSEILKNPLACGKACGVCPLPNAEE